MISYRDMTFCPFYIDCKSAYRCHRPLTSKVRRDAKKAGLPVSMYASPPVCWSPKEPEVQLYLFDPEKAPNEPKEATMCR